MKKLFFLALMTGVVLGGFAQTSSKTLPAGWSCVRTEIGGCFSYILGTTCTEYIYHVEICCGRPSWGSGYQVCHTTTWTTVNPNYRLHSGEEPVLQEKLTLEELVKGYASDAGLKPDDITTFRVTDSAPVQDEAGAWYIVEPNTYKIDKSVPGWSITGINLLPYKKE